jgi:hypothetical protein
MWSILIWEEDFKIQQTTEFVGPNWGITERSWSMVITQISGNKIYIRQWEIGKRQMTYICRTISNMRAEILQPTKSVWPKTNSCFEAFDL